MNFRIPQAWYCTVFTTRVDCLKSFSYGFSVRSVLLLSLVSSFVVGSESVNAIDLQKVSISTSYIEGAIAVLRSGCSKMGNLWKLLSPAMIFRGTADTSSPDRGRRVALKESHCNDENDLWDDKKGD